MYKISQTVYELSVHLLLLSKRPPQSPKKVEEFGEAYEHVIGFIALEVLSGALRRYSHRCTDTAQCSLKMGRVAFKRCI